MERRDPARLHLSTGRRRAPVAKHAHRLAAPDPAAFLDQRKPFVRMPYGHAQIDESAFSRLSRTYSNRDQTPDAYSNTASVSCRATLSLLGAPAALRIDLAKRIPPVRRRTGSSRITCEGVPSAFKRACSDWLVAWNHPLMTVDLRGAGYAASRISSGVKGNTKQFGWLQASATKTSLRVQSFDNTLFRGFATRLLTSGR